MALRRWLAALVAMAACTGTVDDPAAGPSTGQPAPSVPPGVDPLEHPSGLGPTGITRLSRSEYRHTLLDLTGIDPGADVEFLPEDTVTPFDNDYTTQVPSQALVEAARAIASRAADAVLADRTRRDALLGCAPSGPGDEACLRQLITRFGRRAIRRPLSGEEVDELAGLSSHAIEAGDFDVGVSLVLKVLLQHPELLYRVEIGEPVDGGARRLNAFELASRMSFFLWGSGPDDALLDRAERGALETPGDVREEAARMLADRRAVARVQRFHAQWLGYDQIRHAADLAASMRAESDALVERVVFGGQAWDEIFRAEESFLDDTLAEIYGLPAPGEPAWVSLGDTGRRGILSHASFLSGGTKFGDTSPVLRGILVRERLLCQDIPPPPPEVNTDEPPADADPDACKEERYAMHRTGGCAGCHSRIDPIGFGLERYDGQGRFRLHDVGRPECEIAGDGALEDLDATFHGPAELAGVLLDSGHLDDCAMEHLYRFTVGRDARAVDDAAVASLSSRFEGSGGRLEDVLLDLVSSEAFRHRVVDEER